MQGTRDNQIFTYVLSLVRLLVTPTCHNSSSQIITTPSGLTQYTFVELRSLHQRCWPGSSGGFSWSWRGSVIRLVISRVLTHLQHPHLRWLWNMTPSYPSLTTSWWPQASSTRPSRRKGKVLMAQMYNWHMVTATALYWPKRVLWPPRVTESGKRFSSFVREAQG